MQSVYALHQDEHHNLQKEEKFLLKSMEDMQTLYATLMGLWVKLYERGNELLDISKNKYLASEKQRLQNQKIVDNKVLQLLCQDEKLNDLIQEHCAVNWQLYSEYVELIYKQIVESEFYKRYISLQEFDFESDRNLLVELYTHVFATDEKLYDFLQDGQMTWIDDLPTINTLIVKILKGIKQDYGPYYFTPKLYKDVDDKNFAIDLLRKSVLNDELFHQYLEEKIPQWDINRLAHLDAILIKMAIAEFLKFPSIPVKVTINEYVEIAKEYSTPKSSVFINGILDNLSKDFAQKQMLNKIGRGLIG